MTAWHGYIEGVLRPMKEAKGAAKRERDRVVKTLRIAADRIEDEKPVDIVAWLRSEADTLAAEGGS